MPCLPLTCLLTHTRTLLTLFDSRPALPSLHPGLLPLTVPFPPPPQPHPRHHILPTHEFAHLANLASERPKGHKATSHSQGKIWSLGRTRLLSLATVPYFPAPHADTWLQPVQVHTLVP